MLDLFTDAKPWQEPLTSGAVILRHFAFGSTPTLLQAIAVAAKQSLFRQVVTPGGYTMSVMMANCGHLDWATDQHDYFRSPFGPLTGTYWPPLPDAFANLCQQAMTAAGHADLQPDACLVNRYTPEAKPSLHQDRNGPDLRTPIVSISLELPAVFQFGSSRRSNPLKRLLLEHGDVVIWGGNSWLFYHGIQPLKTGYHPSIGDCRYSLTFHQTGKKE